MRSTPLVVTSIIVHCGRVGRLASQGTCNEFQRCALSQADNPETEDELVVDTAHPRNLLQLNFEGPKKPRLWLRSYDYHYSLYLSGPRRSDRLTQRA
ncbi:hypothetical protein [Rhizobium aegyptiacum]|uniref:hypothetical protein n=1 Tax=Rhizobium aegyptiacum TaxID=1764550 RepID=UPI0007E5597B|nr:hypothetical protein [Rhizobium aegyptiacum]